MQTILDRAAAPKRAAPKKKAKPFKLQQRDADLQKYPVKLQRLGVAMRNLYRD